MLRARCLVTPMCGPFVFDPQTRHWCYAPKTSCSYHVWVQKLKLYSVRTSKPPPTPGIALADIYLGHVLARQPTPEPLAANEAYNRARAWGGDVASSCAALAGATALHIRQDGPRFSWEEQPVGQFYNFCESKKVVSGKILLWPRGLVA